MPNTVATVCLARASAGGSLITAFTPVAGVLDDAGLDDVAHLDAVVTKFCILTETSTSIILNAAREHQVMLPARSEDVKPPIKKVENA